MAKPVIAVIGGSGKQGGGVVDALLASGKFTVRAVSRNPVGDAAKALIERGVEVVKGDLWSERDEAAPVPRPEIVVPPLDNNKSFDQEKRKENRDG
jgi:nucleoside-diphosphate-sugar epimerase